MIGTKSLHSLFKTLSRSISLLAFDRDVAHDLLCGILVARSKWLLCESKNDCPATECGSRA